MPNIYTFKIPPIGDIIKRYVNADETWIDPFCGKYSPATITNDSDINKTATYHLDGLDFLKQLEENSIDGVLFDPPYSVEQALRSYKAKCGGTAGRSEYQGQCLRQISRIIKPGGIAICFNWNSNGVGMKRGFRLEEVLLVCHGSNHYDTIVTVEKKLPTTGRMF